MRRSTRTQLVIRGDAGQAMAEYALVLTVITSAVVAFPPFAGRVVALVNVVAGLLH